MKKQVFSLCLAGILAVNLCMPVSAAMLGNVRPNVHAMATPAVQMPTKYLPDAEGQVSFRSLESRVRKGNLAALSLQSSLDSQKAFNRERAYQDLVDAINYMVDCSWGGPMGTSTAMNATIETMRDQLDPLKEKNYKETMETVSRQIEGAIWQIISGTESLYLNILSYESNLEDLNRGLAAMERSIQEIDLRYSLGQISQLTLQQLNVTQQNTKSQAESMQLALENMRTSLNVMLGEPPDTILALQGLPPSSAQNNKILALGYKVALTQAKQMSFSLYSAENTLKDEEEAWTDAKGDYGSQGYNYKVAEQKYQAAVYTYASDVKNFEISFHGLYQAVPDAKQALQAVDITCLYQEKNYAVAQTKHKQGQLSDYQLETIKEDVLAAQSALTVAEIKAFTASNQYQRAVEFGIVG